MRVLVTGGGGFLGSAICRQLRQLGFQPVAYQRGEASGLAEAGIEVQRGDICDRRALAAAAHGCDALIHTAARAGVWGAVSEYHRVNVTGTEAVIETCDALEIPILVHTSSPSIVFSGCDIEGADESLPPACRFPGPYPASKARAEALVLKANGERLKTIALRPHLIWGPGDPHILPRLRARVRFGRLALPGAGKLVDTVFVDNAARAHIDALLNLAGEASGAGRPYFITNGEPMPQGEIIRKLLQASGIEARILPLPGWLARAAGAACEAAWRALRLASEPPVTRFSAGQLCTAHWFDISAARRDLAYRPGVSIGEGLRRLREFAAIP